MSETQHERIPPGQQLLRAGRWPAVGESAPAGDDGDWTLSLRGLFREPRSITLRELSSQPQVDSSIDIHCVTRWSRLNIPFRGIPLNQLLADEHILPEAAYVSFIARSERAHSSSVPLAVARKSLLALEAEGKPLSREHGGPLRVVVPDKYFYKSVKWLEQIELLREDRLGYWEADAGYHNGADPWREERYVAPAISKQQAVRLMAERDFSREDLMGIDASGRELRGLRARAALLRNANFQNATLCDADFTGSNLANAHFQGADLQRAVFEDADLEGANLAGADLRGAALTGASLFGATFFEEATDSAPARAALLDASTKLAADQISLLADDQEQYLRQFITVS
ncbi:MAG: molybdopterin-dependent oxidoreductase [Gammaproteobacteria bacterium]|jgi:DMSO/TMAO reductase YedYZ molybdopterin-dependent catalytic subunit|nr:molybdopterin-dependent oxidoreductase [Gammaproteobacteria bacterium]MDP7266724.1 molybdopterin-dependent oxidoreductase [Pirellulales bacterium]HJN65942.1 molybdopterin-dependent oxidoreductase [Pirellulales bacterium]